MSKKANRIFLIVLDSFGIGASADAHEFGDSSANTLESVNRTGELNIPNMIKLGLGNIDGVHVLPKLNSPIGKYARLREMSRGKDTTTGHWELMGITSSKPMPTYPNGFPAELIAKFEKEVGRGVICNLPYSGTDVIRDFGDEHIKTGKLIVISARPDIIEKSSNDVRAELERAFKKLDMFEQRL